MVTPVMAGRQVAEWEYHGEVGLDGVFAAVTKSNTTELVPPG